MYASGRWKGYWEQAGYGRQTMRDLQFRFGNGEIDGSGHDIVGLFTFAGTFDDYGNVVMIKQYIGAHQVVYEGRYDGEGTIHGRWSIGPWNTGSFALTPDGEQNVAELPILSVSASED